MISFFFEKLFSEISDIIIFKNKIKLYNKILIFLNLFFEFLKCFLYF